MWIKLTSYIKIIDVRSRKPRFSVSYIRGESRLYQKYVYVASSNLNFALDIRKMYTSWWSFLYVLWGMAQKYSGFSIARTFKIIKNLEECPK